MTPDALTVAWEPATVSRLLRASSLDSWHAYYDRCRAGLAPMPQVSGVRQMFTWLREHDAVEVLWGRQVVALAQGRPLSDWWTLHAWVRNGTVPLTQAAHPRTLRLLSILDARASAEQQRRRAAATKPPQPVASVAPVQTSAVTTRPRAHNV